MKTNAYLVLFLLALLGACGPKAKLPEGAPARLSEAKLREALAEAQLQYHDLLLSGTGEYQAEGSKQSFRFELRLLQDSLVWLELSDPFLGLRVARGLLSPGKAAYFNRLEREYFEGSTAELEAQLAFELQFQRLLPLLSANVVPGLAPYQLDYAPGYYLLRDYDPQKPPSEGRETFLELQLDPEHFRPQRQELSEPVNGRRLWAEYRDYQDFGGFLFPRAMRFEYREKQASSLLLQIQKVRRNSDLQFPFSIPDAYRPLP